MIDFLAGARRLLGRAPADPTDAFRLALGSRYRILARIGDGGMADIYSADDRKHGRAVAIKVMKPEVARAIGADRFLSEIRLTASLRHPNILPLYDSGEVDGVLYYVMPLVEGETLANRLAREGQLPLDEVVSVVEDVCDALEHAHERGVVHRDIKPGNIMLEDGHAIVTDFGIARALSGPDASDSRRLTKTGGAIGSPLYMSPEQATGRQEIGTRSDIYSLGCVVYEMLAGEPPFSGPTPLITLARHALDPVPPLATARPGLSPRIVETIERALAKSPADRFESAAAFAHTLAAAVRSGTAATGIAAGTARKRPSIAVLPFVDLAEGPAEAFFVAGMHDTVIAELSKIAGLRVISRTSMLHYAGTSMTLGRIGEELGVDNVMEGSVLRTGDRVRIMLRLTRASDEERLWSETFDRHLTDVLEIHAEVARAVAEAVNARLTEAEEVRLASPASVDPRVYELYLRGRHQSAVVPEEAQRAVRYFEQAIELEPGFAPAHSGLARRLSWLASLGLGDGPDALPRALEAAKCAHSLAPDSADALAVLGYLRLVVDWDPTSARELLERAIELEPGNLDALIDLAFLECATGRFEEAERLIDRMGRIDPLSPATALHRGWFLFMAGRFDEAARHLEEQARRHPWFAYLGVFAGFSDVMRGDLARAAEWARSANAAPPAARGMDFLSGLASLYAYVGLGDDARRVVSELESQLEGERGAWFRWPARLILGDVAVAIRWFDLAIEQRNPLLVLLPYHPVFEPARRHPYLRERIRALGLVDDLRPPCVLPADRAAG